MSTTDSLLGICRDRGSLGIFTVRQLAVVLWLYRHRTDPAQRLVSTTAAALACPRAGMTRMFDKLWAAGFIERTTPAENRRITIGTLTERGLAVAERLENGL